MSYRCQVFDNCATTMSMPQSVAHARGFVKWKCDYIGDVIGICEIVECNKSWLGTCTMPFVRASLGSQILAVIEK